MGVIKVFISTWQVPFEQTVIATKEFTYEEGEAWEWAKLEALTFINLESKKWWNENEGDKWVEQSKADEDIEDVTYCIPYQPITELSYQWARYELWGGENGFHAMLDQESWWKLHEEHYKREYDDKGISRPGYLRNAYGEDTSAEIAEVFAAYAGPAPNDERLN